MYVWQCQAGTRKYARTTGIPQRDEHFSWLIAKLSDPHCEIRIIEKKGVPVGLLRLDNLWDQYLYEVSIIVSLENRGHGIATEALKLIREMCPMRQLYAEIHEENTASEKLFSKSGYVKIRPRGWICTPQATD